MSVNSVEAPFPIFTDVDGNPLEDGYIYIGNPNLNPEVSPKSTFWDSGISVVAAQPIRTLGGYPSRSGTVARIYVEGDYSITVRNKNGTLVYSSAVSTGILSSINSFSSMSGLIGYTTSPENTSVNVSGYYAPNDEGGGLFNWDSTIDKSTADGGIIIDPSVSLALQGTGVGTGCWKRQFTGPIEVKWFGAVGDGTTDDTLSVQKMYNYLKANGGTGVLNPGYTYGTTTIIYITAGTLPFTVTGYGATIKRISDFLFSVIEINTTDGVVHKGMEIDAQHQTYANGNHGLVYSNCDDSLAEDVTVRNHKNSAIIMYASVAGTKTNNIQRNCKALGNVSFPANNGLLIAAINYSRIENGYAEYCSGSPGYGLQLKNECLWSSVSGKAKNCVAAGAFGNDISAPGVTDSYANIELSENCSNAFAASYADRNSINIGTVLSPNVSSLNSIDLTQCDFNSINVGVVKADGANQVLVRFRTGCSDNFVKADVLYRTLGTANGCAGTFDIGVTNNQVQVGRVSNATVTTTSSMITDLSTNVTNMFEYEYAPSYTTQVISAGAITIGTNKYINVGVDTEAAAATDDLDTITGAGVEGQTIRVRANSNLRDIVVKHGTGNIALNGLVDYTLDTASDTLLLSWSSATSLWCEVGRGNNA